MSIQRRKHNKGGQRAIDLAVAARARHIEARQEIDAQRETVRHEEFQNRTSLVDLAKQFLGELTPNALLLDKFADDLSDADYSETRLAFDKANRLALSLDRALRMADCSNHDFPNEPQLVRIAGLEGQKPSLLVVGSIKQEDAYRSIIDNDSDLNNFAVSILDNPNTRDIGADITPIFMGAFSKKPQTKGGAARLFTPVQPVDMIYDTRRYIACQIAGPQIGTRLDVAAIKLALVWETMKMNPSKDIINKHEIDEDMGSHFSGRTDEMRKGGLRRAADTGLLMTTRKGLTAYFPMSQFASKADLHAAMQKSSDTLGLDVMPQKLNLQLGRFAIAS